MKFELDARLSTGSHVLAALPLCEARLQDDVRFAWIVLVPRRAALVEIADLAPRDRRRLWAEATQAAAAVRAVGEALGRPISKLNHGQLGNIVAQLHLHVVGRRPDDPAWPGPVWGSGKATPYDVETLRRAVSAARAALAR